MDVKEAIDILKYENLNFGKEKHHIAMTMAIEALERTRWIPVSERLPKQYTSVLVYHDITGITDEAWFSGWFKYPYDADSRNSSNYGDVTHWMPLPKPPEIE